MKTEDFSLGWVDLAIVGILVIGIIRGRKRGMSEELLDVIKWLSIVAAAGFGYEPMGSFLSGATMFSHLGSYLAMYTLVLLALLLFFAFLKRQLGGKLLGCDLFGSGEYYLGMFAGFIRYACILLVVFALLNARYYSPDEVSSHIKYQLDNYGSMYFPTLFGMQHEVFAESCTGRFIHNYLAPILIRPTSPEEKGLGAATVLRAREQNVYDVLEKR